PPSPPFPHPTRFRSAGRPASNPSPCMTRRACGCASEPGLPVTLGQVVVDGGPIDYEGGDSLAMAILRTGEVPGHGGCLCLAGDCGNCLAEVDGVAYVRTCQVLARPGMVVQRRPTAGRPQLPSVDDADTTRTPLGPEIVV